jgi:hypothetical protein
MPGLMFHVEGQTEARFVDLVLREHLLHCNYSYITSRFVGDGAGGICGWPAARKSIVNHLRKDPHLVVTTMVDFYGLPSKGRGWPGREEATHLRFEDKAQHVERAILDDIAREIGPRFDPRRFVPFVLMHEFEALLFSDCTELGEALGAADRNTEFQRIRDQFLSPEEINDSVATAPSKRISALVPRYDKVLYGVDAAQRIGLERIRRECGHFDSWLTRLESLNQ